MNSSVLKIAGSVSSRVVLLLCYICSISTFEMLFAPEANAVLGLTNAVFGLINKSQANREKNNAVAAERKKWQDQINKNSATIKTLQTDLKKKQDEAAKLRQEKSSYEAKAKGELLNVQNQKKLVETELAKLKQEKADQLNEFTQRSKELETQIQQEQAENTKLQESIVAAEKSRKDYEAKMQNEIDKTKRNYDAKIKKLNSQISTKTRQLRSKNASLKKLTAEYAAQTGNWISSEANHLVAIELTKSEVLKLKAELQSVIAKAKEMEKEKWEQLKALQTKSEIERRNFNAIIEENQRKEAIYLEQIDALQGELNELRKRYDELLNAGKIVETRLLEKISHLSKIQTAAKKRYELMAKAYADAEAKNLLTIDTLKEGIKKVVKTNKSLLKFADKFRKAKVAEDAADAKLEAAMLLKMDDLQSELDKTTAQNKMLLGSVKEIGKNLGKARENEVQNEKKYQKTIKELSDEIEKLKGRYEKLSKWTYETGYLPQEKVSDIFKNGYRKLGESSKEKRGRFSEGRDSRKMTKQPRWYDFHKNLQNETPMWNFDPHQWYRQNSAVSQGSRSWSYQGYTPFFPPRSYSMNQRSNASMNYRYRQGGEKNGYVREQRSVNAGGVPYSGNSSYNRSIVGELNAVQKVETREDQLVAFAVDSILKAVQKMTNYDVYKTNAAMNLIGAGHDLPSKLSAVIDVIKEQFDPKILDKAMETIFEKYSYRQNFVDESLRHMYGTEGNKLPNWNAELG